MAALRGSFTRDVGRQALLQLAAERIQAAGPPYTSVYLYMLHGDELVLEAFSGRDTEHTRIAGRAGGVRHRGRHRRTTRTSPDVRAIGNYIACNTFTRSELVVLIRRGNDDPGPDRRRQRRARSVYAAEEEAAVRAVADGLASLL